MSGEVRRSPMRRRRTIARRRALLKQRVDVNAPQADGMTALHWAVYHDDAEMAEQLLRAGASVKAATRYGVTPLSLACTNGGDVLVELLLKAGADPNLALPGGETPLMTAARTGALGVGEGARVPWRQRRRQGRVARANRAHVGRRRRATPTSCRSSLRPAPDVARVCRRALRRCSLPSGKAVSMSFACSSKPGPT